MKHQEHYRNQLQAKFAELPVLWRRFELSGDGAELHRFMTRLAPVELAMLDHQVRGADWRVNGFGNELWGNLRPAGVARLAQSESASSLLGLASLHSIGYIREAAVAALAGLQTGAELPFLLLRLNDWVAPVRAAAAAAILRRLAPANAPAFLANLRVIHRLQNCGQVDPTIIAAMMELLKRPECEAILQTGMSANDRVVRRLSFQLAVEARPANRSTVFRTLLADPDGTTRHFVVRQCLPGFPPEELPGLVAPLLLDRFMPIRRAALLALAEHRPDSAAEAVRQALLDGHGAIREVARYYSSLAGATDLRAFYLAAIASATGARQAAAIRGLGETGLSGDSARLIPFLHSPRPVIRGAATCALGKLDAEKHLATLVQLLSDPSYRVSAAALPPLVARARQIPLETLESLLLHAKCLHVRRNALRLILHHGKWRKLPALLTACDDSDPRIGSSAMAALINWREHYNQSFAEPTRLDYDRILAQLPKVKAQLPKGWSVHLQACLKATFP